MNLRRNISILVLVCFVSTSIITPKNTYAQGVLGLPAPGSIVNLSPAYQPVIIRGLTVHKDNPFLFDFIVDAGQDNLSGQPLKQEGEKLIKYFLASLAIPDKDAWVNLSPYEKDRIIPQALGQTDMGRDLLEQDYILKQITASLIYPERQLGKAFWQKVYAKAQSQFGTTQIPVNTFNKVWIMADRAEVFEHNQTAFVVGQHLKVMLEEDYLSLSKHADVGAGSKPAQIRDGLEPSPTDINLHSLGSQIIRQIILPELEHEVNTGKNFANLRQIFNSIILASWYKRSLKQALLNQVYANHSMVKGINLNDPGVKEQIYEEYLKAYKKGVFNYIKQDVVSSPNALIGDPNTTIIPRKYFSGGLQASAAMLKITKDANLGAQEMAKWDDKVYDFNTFASLDNTAPNAAMMSLVKWVVNLKKSKRTIVRKIVTDWAKSDKDVKKALADLRDVIDQKPPEEAQKIIEERIDYIEGLLGKANLTGRIVSPEDVNQFIDDPDVLGKIAELAYAETAKNRKVQLDVEFDFHKPLPNFIIRITDRSTKGRKVLYVGKDRSNARMIFTDAVSELKKGASFDEIIEFVSKAMSSSSAMMADHDYFRLFIDALNELLLQNGFEKDRKNYFVRLRYKWNGREGVMSLLGTNKDAPVPGDIKATKDIEFFPITVSISPHDLKLFNFDLLEKLIREGTRDFVPPGYWDKNPGDEMDLKEALQKANEIAVQKRMIEITRRYEAQFRSGKVEEIQQAFTSLSSDLKVHPSEQGLSNSNMILNGFVQDRDEILITDQSYPIFKHVELPVAKSSLKEESIIYTVEFDNQSLLPKFYVVINPTSAAMSANEAVKQVLAKQLKVKPAMIKDELSLKKLKVVEDFSDILNQVGERLNFTSPEDFNGLVDQDTTVAQLIEFIEVFQSLRKVYAYFLPAEITVQIGKANNIAEAISLTRRAIAKKQKLDKRVHTDDVPKIAVARQALDEWDRGAFKLYMRENPGISPIILRAKWRDFQPTAIQSSSAAMMSEAGSMRVNIPKTMPPEKVVLKDRLTDKEYTALKDRKTSDQTGQYLSAADLVQVLRMFRENLIKKTSVSDKDGPRRIVVINTAPYAAHYQPIFQVGQYLGYLTGFKFYPANRGEMRSVTTPGFELAMEKPSLFAFEAQKMANLEVENKRSSLLIKIDEIENLVLESVGLRGAPAVESPASTDTSAAMQAPALSSTKGGIDLNTANGMQWKMGRDGQGVEMNINPAMLAQIKKDGIQSLSPVVLKMTLVPNIWSWAGIKAPSLN